MSIFKYILTDSKFSIKDKIYFFGFLFCFILFVISIIWFSYKGVFQNIPNTSLGIILIISLILLIFLKIIRQFAEKFVVPYENFMDREQAGFKIQRKMEYLMARQKLGFKYSKDNFILGISALAIFFLIPLLLPQIIPLVRTLPQEIIPIGFIIVAFLLFTLLHIKCLPYHEELKKTAQKYHMWGEEKKVFVILFLIFFIIFCYAICWVE